MDGFAVLEALRRDPATSGVTVIVVTGSESLFSGARARVLSLGAADIVSKPFDVDDLIAEISALTQPQEASDGDPGAGGG
jgi:DNA-binding response OmpR family regulator